MATEPRLYTGRPERLLVVAAWPADADEAIAGSVFLWQQAGTLAHLACCTSGESDTDDVYADPLTVAAQREREQRAAASATGYEGITFLHRPDGAVVNDLALREQLVRLMRTFRPDTVAVPDPTVLFTRHGGIQHVDRREAGLAGADAAQASARSTAFPHMQTSEGLVAHQVRQVLLYWPARPLDVVDISDSIGHKLDSLECYRSRASMVGRLAERIRRDATDAGAGCGVEAAEAFSIIDLV